MFVGKNRNVNTWNFKDDKVCVECGKVSVYLNSSILSSPGWSDRFFPLPEGCAGARWWQRVSPVLHAAVRHIFNEVLAENAALVFALFEILVFVWLC